MTYIGFPVKSYSGMNSFGLPAEVIEVSLRLFGLLIRNHKGQQEYSSDA